MSVAYGAAPTDLGYVDLSPSEMMVYLYLPIHMPGRDLDIRIPRNIEYLRPMIDMAVVNARSTLDLAHHYIYATVKTLFVTGSFSGNRPGLHADGYASGGDLNYLWYNMNPTQFAVQDFHDIPTGDFESMEEMERQLKPERLVEYPYGHLLRLDESNLHRVNPLIEEGMRTFVKLSFSRHRFNLAGNSHNYLFDYEWEMHGRGVTRNLDSNNRDWVETA